jgi:hypothetical protein
MPAHSSFRKLLRPPERHYVDCWHFTVERGESLMQGLVALR